MMIRSPGFSTTLNDITAPLRSPTPEERLKILYRRYRRKQETTHKMGFAATCAAQAGGVQNLRLGQSCNLNGATLFPFPVRVGCNSNDEFHSTGTNALS